MMLSGCSQRPHNYTEALCCHHFSCPSTGRLHALAPESRLYLKIAAPSWHFHWLVAIWPPLLASSAWPACSCGFYMFLHISAWSHPQTDSKLAFWSPQDFPVLRLSLRFIVMFHPLCPSTPFPPSCAVNRSFVLAFSLARLFTGRVGSGDRWSVWGSVDIGPVPRWAHRCLCSLEGSALMLSALAPRRLVPNKDTRFVLEPRDLDWPESHLKGGPAQWPERMIWF